MRSSVPTGPAPIGVTVAVSHHGYGGDLDATEATDAWEAYGTAHRTVYVPRVRCQQHWSIGPLARAWRLKSSRS